MRRARYRLNGLDALPITGARAPSRLRPLAALGQTSPNRARLWLAGELCPSAPGAGAFGPHNGAGAGAPSGPGPLPRCGSPKQLVRPGGLPSRPSRRRKRLFLAALRVPSHQPAKGPVWRCAARGQRASPLAATSSEGASMFACLEFVYCEQAWCYLADLNHPDSHPPLKFSRGCPSPRRREIQRRSASSP